MTDRSHERFEHLLVRATDGLLEPDELAQLERHLEQCERCRDELHDFRRIKEATDAMTARILADASIEPVRPGAATRGVLSLGFLLLAAGALVLVGFAAYLFFFVSPPPLWVRLGVALGALGGLLLLGHVLRVRLRALKRDPYREVDQ